jgi:hypothetical protein
MPAETNSVLVGWPRDAARSSFSPENPGNPLTPQPGWNPKFSSFVVRRRRVNN